MKKKIINKKLNFFNKKNILIAIITYILLAIISLLLAKIFSVNKGESGIYFSEFKTPLAVEIKNKFLNSQSFLLKPPFVFTYSLSLVVNLDKFRNLYSEANNIEEMKRVEENIKMNGTCKINNETGSWEVWVTAYTFFGYPIKTILTCNDGLQ